MTRAEILAKFPHATESFIDRMLTGSQSVKIHSRSENHSHGLCAVQSKPAKRLSLDAPALGEETRWYDAAKRFEIVFTVYSRWPCDWDGYDIKALQDFCVKAGILPGDGWKTLAGRVVSAKAATEAEERTEIEIRLAD